MILIGGAACVVGDGGAEGEELEVGIGGEGGGVLKCGAESGEDALGWAVGIDVGGEVEDVLGQGNVERAGEKRKLAAVGG